MKERESRILRWTRLLARVRPALIAAIKKDEIARAKTLLSRYNAICRDRRNRNIKNGALLNAWEDATIEGLKEIIKKKGL